MPVACKQIIKGRGEKGNDQTDFFSRGCRGLRGGEKEAMEDRVQFFCNLRKKGNKAMSGENSYGDQYCTQRDLWEMQLHQQEGRRRIKELAVWGIALGLLNIAVSIGIVIFILTIV